MAAPSLRNMAIATAMALLPWTSSAAALGPQVVPRAAANNIWVTVNPQGQAQTITPVVTTVDGKTTTVSTAPPSLVTTGTYTLSPSGAQSTFTGNPPAAAATGTTGPAGAFIYCDIYQAASPFCQPKEGAMVKPDKSYYITWSSETFDNKSNTVQIQLAWDGRVNLRSDPLPVTQGFWVWSPPASLLDGKQVLDVSIRMMYNDTDATGKWTDKTEDGPTVHLTNDAALTNYLSPAQDTGSSGGVSAAAVAVPIVVVVLLLVAGFIFWRWRKGRGGAGASTGRAARTMQPEPAGKTASDTGIQLTDRDSWNAGGTGRNVFREEVARQQRQEGK